MATTKCKKCGCEDSFLISPAPCPTPEGCPDPEPCSESFDAQCIVYTGDDILCNQDTVVAFNDNVSDALNSIVDYFCANESYIENVTLQGTNLTFTGVGLAFDGVVSLASISGSVNANNGLTLATGNTVQLGGTLILDTTVTTVDYDMIFTGARVNNQDSILTVSNTGQGGGIYATSSLNNPITGYCSGSAAGGVFISEQSSGLQATTRSGNSNIAGVFANITTLSNSLPTVLRLENYITGATLPANRVGASLDYYIPRINSTGNKQNDISNQIQSVFSDVANATLTSALLFRGRSGGTAMKDLVTFQGDGEVQFHEYGVGNFVNAPAYMLGVDASGNVVEVAL
jgi:hypothetical protein